VSGAPDTKGLVDCNLVMKGGVTSGLVYARAFAVLARRYRFRGVGGSSAGAIAAGFAAAAEFARQRGDPEGFARLEQRCEALPALLPGFFRAEAPFEPLIKALIRLAPGTGRAAPFRAVLCLWRPLLVGALAGVSILGLLYAALGAWAAGPLLVAPGLLLAALVGALIGLSSWLLRRLSIDLPRSNYGFCSGRSGLHTSLGITDWVHESLQYIAYGAGADRAPLTFGELTAHGIELKLVATSVNFPRLEILPDLSFDAVFRPSDWARLFPPSVMDAMCGGATEGRRKWPAKMPVLAAIRMSIACPGLLQAVPVETGSGDRVLLADGGLTCNFPFDLFDEPETARPTLAFDLATLHHPNPAESRVTTLAEALRQGVRPGPTRGLKSFVWALIVALREGATQSAMLESAQRVQIFQMRLAAEEGGMRLEMNRSDAQDLLAHGQALGEYVLRTKVNSENSRPFSSHIGEL
jgi:predicted acylesterase/phospholipase RssA